MRPRRSRLEAGVLGYRGLSVAHQAKLRTREALTNIGHARGLLI